MDSGLLVQRAWGGRRERTQAGHRGLWWPWSCRPPPTPRWEQDGRAAGGGAQRARLISALTMGLSVRGSPNWFVSGTGTTGRGCGRCGSGQREGSRCAPVSLCHTRPALCFRTCPVTPTHKHHHAHAGAHHAPRLHTAPAQTPPSRGTAPARSHSKPATPTHKCASHSHPDTTARRPGWCPAHLHSAHWDVLMTVRVPQPQPGLRLHSRGVCHHCALAWAGPATSLSQLCVLAACSRAGVHSWTCPGPWWGGWA